MNAATSTGSRRQPLWITAGVVILVFVALLFAVEAVDTVLGNRLDTELERDNVGIGDDVSPGGGRTAPGTAGAEYSDDERCRENQRNQSEHSSHRPVLAVRNPPDIASTRHGENARRGAPPFPSLTVSLSAYRMHGNIQRYYASKYD